MWTFIVVFILLTAGHRAQEYDNYFRGWLNRVCPADHAVSQIKSSYSPTVNDRRWKIECKPFDSTTQCSWSAHLILHTQQFRYNCPPNHVITGVYSDYISGERRWSFYCCSAQKLITFECQETPVVNYWKEDFNWHVPGGNFLTGFHIHDKNNGDYRWSFSYCRGTTQDLQTVSSDIMVVRREGDVSVQTNEPVRIFDLVSVPASLLDLTLIVIYTLIFCFIFMRLFTSTPSRNFRFHILLLHLVFFHVVFYVFLTTFQRELLYFLLHYFYLLIKFST